MTAYKDLSKEELLELKSGLEAQFEEVKAKRSETGYVQRKTVSRPARSLNGINERIKQRFRPQVRNRSRLP